MPSSEWQSVVKSGKVAVEWQTLKIECAMVKELVAPYGINEIHMIGTHDWYPWLVLFLRHRLLESFERPKAMDES